MARDGGEVGGKAHIVGGGTIGEPPSVDLRNRMLTQIKKKNPKKL